MAENSEVNKSFLGTGWGFPPTFRKETGGVEMVSGEDDIRQSLEILLHTRIGERFLVPTYGCELKSYIFEPLTSTLESKLRDLISTAILYHEPRIEPNEIHFLKEPQENRLVIEIAYTVISTNTRNNIVFPFYLDEGTDIPK